jgi:hypothetical protein
MHRSMSAVSRAFRAKACARSSGECGARGVFRFGRRELSLRTADRPAAREDLGLGSLADFRRFAMQYLIQHTGVLFVRLTDDKAS